jgi:hypothetical protein
MNPNKFNPDKKQEFSDGKYSVYTFLEGSDKKFRRLSCDTESICVIPFELNERGQIKNIYLLKYEDYLLGGNKFTCITDSFNKNKFDSHYLAVEDCLSSSLRISDIDINDSYFLGTVSHGIPFSKEYKCYAVNITDSLASLDSSTIIPIKFNRVINGDFSDSLVLSCSLLLLSYFSE